MFSGAAGGFGEIGAAAGIQDGAGAVDDDGAARPPAGAHGSFGVATLCADAGDEQRQARSNGAHARDFFGPGGTDDEAKLPVGVPAALREARDVFKDAGLPVHVGEAAVLQIGAAGV